MAVDLTLDAGHGGKDPGAVGPTGLHEADVTLKLVKKAGTLIAAQGYSVNYTRTSDVFVELDDRAAIANNAGAKDFLSIHINSASALATGTETYCYSRGGSGEKMATAIQASLVAAIGKANRGVKTANFAVIRETNMPAALAEIVFISNPAEEALLKDDAFLDKVAQAIAKGYCNYKGKAYSNPQPAQQPTPSVMYRVILDGTQVMALSDQANAEAKVKEAVDGGQAKTGKVQRNTDGVDVFTYVKPEPKPVDPPAEPAKPIGVVPIVGPATATVGQAQAWAKASGATQEFINLAPLYWSIGPSRCGIDPVVAYTQAAKETGYGKFGGVLDASYCNPCGLKKKDGGSDTDPNAHKKFSSWEEGVTAHLDHLALYAGVAGYPRTDTADERQFDFIKGKCPTVESLGANWAPNAAYGNDIVKLMQALQATAEPVKVQVDPADLQQLKDQVATLTAQLNAKTAEADGYKASSTNLAAQVDDLKKQLAAAGDASQIPQLQKDIETANNRAVVAEREVDRLNGQLSKWDGLKKLLKEFIGGI
jgi:N-acetylmuramoyl-L-alanine amidase